VLLFGGPTLRKSWLFWSIALLAPAFAQQSQPPFDGKSWWEHIKVLAADNMEGRDTGSSGLKRAEAYVVGQLKTAGLQPAGVRGYYQAVKFESRQRTRIEFATCCPAQLPVPCRAGIHGAATAGFRNSETGHRLPTRHPQLRRISPSHSVRVTGMSKQRFPRSV